MAFNTPYKLFKRYASHEGGIADTAIISWPNGIAAHGEVRDNYVNVCDITPTVYDLLGMTPPATVKGIAQKPLDGVSFKAALEDSEADTGKDTQFYTMLGTRGIWHKGWFANTVHAATPAGWSHFDKDRWELYHIEADRSQCHDLAAENPDKLEEMKALWFSEAAKYNGPAAGRPEHPGDDDAVAARIWCGDRKSFVYYPDTAEVGMGAAAEPRGQSLSVLAEVTIDTTGAEGVLFKQGGAHGGHVLFIQDGAAALHLQLHGRGGTEGVVARRGSAGQAHLRRQLQPHRHRREQPHAARRSRRSTSTATPSASMAEREGASGNVRTGRCHASASGATAGSAVSQYVQGPVRIHRRHHRAGQRRPFRRAVCGRGKRTRTGLLEGLMMKRNWLDGIGPADA